MELKNKNYNKYKWIQIHGSSQKLIHHVGLRKVISCTIFSKNLIEIVFIV